MQGQIGERQDECPRQLPGRPLEVAGDRGSRWMVAQGLVCRDEGFDAVNLTTTWTELGLQSASPRLRQRFRSRRATLKPAIDANASRYNWLMPKIDISDAVLQALRQRAEPFVDTSPNDVIERLLGLAGLVRNERRQRRRPRVGQDRWTRYKLAPIVIEVLHSMGGQLRVGDVLQLVEDRIRDRLSEKDLELLERNNFRRWESETRWAREVLIKQGLLESGGRGIWRLTDQGHLEAANLTNRSGDED